MARAGGARARFVVAGRIMWQKDVELAIDAFAAAATRGAHAELVVAGAVDAKSVPYLAELRRRSQGLDVRFEVDVSDERMTELLGSALVVLHPSPNEDFGITPLEAMAAGTPVLAVDAGGVRETVVHGETGWLVPATPSAFADVLARVADEPDRAHAMAAACRRRAAAFSWNAFVGRIDEVMESVADGRAAPRPDYHRPP
jgi:glycosyltransferase involved in cell wall biosynthesis